MQLINFIKSNKDWEEKLQKEPYCISVKRKDNFAIFTYNQIASDFSNPLVRECRGVILDVNTLTPVCVPFWKFGNYGESYVPEIDWSTAKVQEKIDGSLIKVWWYAGKWHISTNGTIDAHDAPIGQYGDQSFYDLFIDASKDVLDYSRLNQDYTYMFELVSPYNKVVVPYSDTKIYHIGTRNNKTLQELDVDIGIEKPKTYPLYSLQDCIEAAKQLSYNQEGYVVVDGHWNRIKVKSPQYIAAAHLRHNGVVTLSRIIAMLKQNEQEEFLTYFPEFHAMINQTINNINWFVETMNGEIAKVSQLVSQLTRKEFAEIAKQTVCPALMFNWLDGKVTNVREWLMTQSDNKIAELITSAKSKDVDTNEMVSQII